MSASERFTVIKKKMEADYNANRAEWQNFWSQAATDTRLEAGDSSLTHELNPTLPNNFSGQWYFNRVRPLLNMVSGHQRRTRKSSVVVPMENADQETADQWSKILLQIYKKEGVYESVSDAFHHGACISGLNLLQVYLDFSHDPVNGDIKVDRVPYSSVTMDPYFKKMDLSDCKYIWRRSYVGYDEATALIPDKADEIMALPTSRSGSSSNSKFSYMPQTYGMTNQGLLAYDEYYYRTYRKQRMLIDKETGDVMEVTIDDNDYMKSFLDENPQVGLIEQNVPTVRLAIAIQDKLMFEGPQPLGIDRFPFSVVTGYFTPELSSCAQRFQSIARSLRDPQMLLNRRIILSADMAESVATTGFIYKENAIVDVKHLFETGAGRMIPLKREAQMTDILPIPPPHIPQEFFALQETFSKELNSVSGINEELMGATDDGTTAGILSALRQGAGLTTLQPLFDKLDYAQVILSEIIMDAVRANYTPGKIKNVLGGDEPAPLFYNKAFGKYRCMVEAGFDTESQKQIQFAQLMQLKELGIEIPEDVLINAATLQNKNDLIESIEQKQQAAAEQAQQQAQAQQQLQAAQAELASARAQADQGLALERVSRVPENRAFAIERLAEAEKDRGNALLNKVKTLKELEDLDIAHIERLVALANMLKNSDISRNDAAALEPINTDASNLL